MRLSPDNKILFVSTMKCATNSMYEILSDWTVMGLDYHGRPNNLVFPTQFTICRNPYDRAVSIWASTCLRDGDRYGAKARIESKSGDPSKFKDFVRHCLNEKWSTNEGLFMNQTDWHRHINRFVPIENLEELRDIVDVDIPVLNTSSHGDWKEYMTPKIIARLNKWAGKDFMLGYEKL